MNNSIIIFSIFLRWIWNFLRFCSKCFIFIEEFEKTGSVLDCRCNCLFNYSIVFSLRKLECDNNNFVQISIFHNNSSKRRLRSLVKIWETAKTSPTWFSVLFGICLESNVMKIISRYRTWFGKTSTYWVFHITSTSLIKMRDAMMQINHNFSAFFTSLFFHVKILLDSSPTKATVRGSL